METEYNYTCPNCSKECLVPESLTGQNLTCPYCSTEFFATLPEPEQSSQSETSLPEKLPFFKFSRKKILEKRMKELVADGELDKNDDRKLKELASYLQLNDSVLTKIKQTNLLNEFTPIKQRIESSWHATDEDLEAIKRLEKKYDIKLSIEGDINLMRAIYLLEEKGEVPQPIQVGVTLRENEAAYYSVNACWHQTRVRTRGSSGISVSVPTGIKGVRFRTASYTPMRSEELTPLSDGVFFVTSKRFLFDGETRSTTINFNKIIDCEVFQDAFKINKETGKPDHFAMPLRNARYLYALFSALKSR